MGNQRLNNQGKERKCSRCHRDTEYYCNTYEHDLCLQCKERHVIDLDTKHHDVIYREKYENPTKHETCEIHPDMIYDKYCHSCELPVCVKCAQQKNHQMLDITTVYETKCHQNREIINNIRSETIYNTCVLLIGIKTDIERCQIEISSHLSEMSRKAQTLKDLIDTVICDANFRHKTLMIQRLQQQIRKMNRYFASLETLEHRLEQSANRPVKLLLFLRKPRVSMKKNNAKLTKHIMLSMTKEINRKNVTK
ncbi:E3 ubiquitin-protein ligase TRIM63-like [Saccostrea echinata]|uniref:E3 ubiquitin-protein ligase TRIM63-like n=1 Tax=Saccostrea echinata TaxID=191078 RepID=UPI002A82BA54|nr:E3 ubiquitin-protein ligase TRIM63-like [Saccostrea echinata]